MNIKSLWGQKIQEWKSKSKKQIRKYTTQTQIKDDYQFFSSFIHNLLSFVDSIYYFAHKLI